MMTIPHTSNRMSTGNAFHRHTWSMLRIALTGVLAALLAAPVMAQHMPAAASSSTGSAHPDMIMPDTPPSKTKSLPSLHKAPVQAAQQDGAKPKHDAHGMQHMDGNKGMNSMSMPMREDDRPPPIGSLPRSDGSAPKPYRAYGITLHMPNDPLIAKFMFDSLESTHGRDGTGQAWELKAWAGGNIDRVWLRSEGERSGGRVEDAEAELLWGHAIDAYWDLMLGARHDFGQGQPTRNWAAFGVQGLAPYQFDFESTIYLGPSGRSALRLRATREWLFTQRLILEPELEFNVYGRADPQRHLGAGLSDASLSLRLRYEFSRKFAPYVGYAWIRKFGATASIARKDNAPVLDRQWLLGVRVWF
jgi:copper resistance protein B